MTLRAQIINIILRLFEKPTLRRANDPVKLRRSFERKARMMFHPPRGTEFVRERIGGILCTRVRPPLVPQATRGPILLYFHGGGYVFGSARTHRALAAQIGQRVGCAAVVPDYALAPENPFPAAVNDALGVFTALAGQVGADNIIVGGDSAGGGLALALVGELLRKAAPCPVAVFAFSPLTDMTFSASSLMQNAESDVLLPADRAAEMAAFYLSGDDATDPRASPLYADFSGGPPVWLTVGDREILLDDSTRMADKLRAAGVDVSLNVAQDLPHVWPLVHALVPEARATLDELAGWLRMRLH